MKSESKAVSPPPVVHECITNFIQLRDRFGDIWSEWKKKRETYGPGFYLYLGTRRGVRLYVENRFANLVFGLEAFHRRKYPPSEGTKLDAKIKRILAGVSRPRDKKWLEDVLDRTREPPLGQRLFATLREVPLGLDDTRLIPNPRDQNLCAQSLNPMDMIIQGWSASLFQAWQQWSRMLA